MAEVVSSITRRDSPRRRRLRRRAALCWAHRAHARPVRRTHVRLDPGGHGRRPGARLPRRDPRPRRPRRRETAERAALRLAFSLGVPPAQMLAQNRPGARGALLSTPASRLGVRPRLARRGTGADPRHGRRPDLRRRRRHRRCPRAVDQAKDAELFLYPGDQHYFADSSLPSYDPDATALLTERVLDFLRIRRIGPPQARRPRHAPPSPRGGSRFTPAPNSTPVSAWRRQ